MESLTNDYYDPSELIALCDSVIEDGEISGSELYALAEWLNNNREACFRWPGELLVKPLQDVWADEKVTKTEMRQIGRLLVRIRKEWAKRQATQAAQQAMDLAEQAREFFDLSTAKVPSLPIDFTINSSSTKGMSYEVDLSHPSCSCPDWKTVRSRIPTGHLSRCCKHVLGVYNILTPKAGWPGWLGAFFECGFPPHPQQEWFLVRSLKGYALASTAGPTGWANVFALADGEYQRFGYSVDEGRWSYGISPPNETQIKSAITENTRCR